jgi:DNA-directed RNA polymerase subunit K/omega
MQTPTRAPTRSQPPYSPAGSGFRVPERTARVVHRPIEVNAFEFAVLAGLRAAQLTRGCTPRVTCSEKVTITAQMEVAEGKVVRAPYVALVGR